MIPGMANFNGKHNRSKVKVWMYLSSIKNTGKKGATLNEIHEKTGVPIFTLRKSMSKWWSWQRVHKIKLVKPLIDGSKDIYSLSATGQRYLNGVVPDGFFEECKQEILDWQAEGLITKEQKHREFIEAQKARMIAERDSGSKFVPIPNPNRNRILTG